MSAPPRLVSAGAGTGKTYWIVERVVERVHQGLPLERVAAVTFTEAAAAELQDRIRAGLLAIGNRDQAARVDAASICTIHRFALTLLQRYPLAAGLPPEPIVLDERQSERLLELSIADLFRSSSEGEIETVRVLLEKGLGPGLGLTRRGHQQDDSPAGRLRSLVALVIEKARSLGMSANDLRREAEIAAERLEDELGPPGDGARLSARFDEKLNAALDFVKRFADPPTKTDRDIYEILLPCLETPPAGDDWLDLAFRIAKVGKISQKFEPGRALVESAEEIVCHHPDARARLLDCVRGVIGAASSVLARFETEKRRIGALDFEDMQVLALELLTGHGGRGSGYAPLVAQVFRYIVVDEFQDTSPLQFRIFEVLREHGSEVVYVGDLKQAIYAFRTADSKLFGALLQRAADRGEPIERLTSSRRSRPELVDFANDLFGAVMPPAGLSFEPLVADNAYSQGACPKAIPSIELIVHPHAARGEMKDAKEHALITRLRALVEGREVQVLDRASGLVRPARWSDVAILTRTRDQVKHWAGILRACGIPTVADEAGPFDTLEVQLACAWLRMLANARDTVAAASVLLSEMYGISQRTMVRMALANVLGSPARALEIFRRDPDALPLTPFEQRALQRCEQDLSDCRRALRQLPLAEAVETALERVDLALRLSLKTDAVRAARIRANLRRVSEIAYELSARNERALDLTGASGITIENLLVELERARSGTLPQQSFDEDVDGVRIGTIHSSKGLEYPIVVIDALGEKLEVRLPRVEVARPDDSDVLLGADALARSGILFVPDVGPRALADRLRGLFEGDRTLRAEWLRLLYVAVTRAREHLVLFWPDEPKTLSDTRYVKHLLTDHVQRVPYSAGETTWSLTPEGRAHRVRVIHALAPPSGWLCQLEASVHDEEMQRLRELVESEREVSTVKPAEPSPTTRLSLVAPTELCRIADCPEVPRLAVLYPHEHRVARVQGEQAQVVPIVSAGPERRALEPEPDPTELGTLLHGAIERVDLLAAGEAGIEQVRSFLQRRGVVHEGIVAFVSRAVVSVRDALRHIGTKEIVARELPFVMDLEGVTVRGTMDLVVRTSQGIHVLDLKTHMVHETSVGRWVGYYRPQLDTYALALSRLGTGPVVGRHLVLPASGMLVTLPGRFDPEETVRRVVHLADLLATGASGPGEGNDCTQCDWRALCSYGRSATSL